MILLREGRPLPYENIKIDCRGGAIFAKQIRHGAKRNLFRLPKTNGYREQGRAIRESPLRKIIKFCGRGWRPRRPDKTKESLHIKAGDQWSPAFVIRLSFFSFLQGRKVRGRVQVWNKTRTSSPLLQKQYHNLCGRKYSKYIRFQRKQNAPSCLPTKDF